MEIKELSRKRKYKGTTTNKGILRLFKSILKKADKVLDVGAGSGVVINAIKEKYSDAKVSGIDIEPVSNEVIKASITDIPFEDNSFDSVISTDVIEHLTDMILDKGLSEIQRVLKRGGKAIITTLLEEDLSKSSYKCPKCGTIFHRAGHVQEFTKEELIHRIQKVGLTVEKIKITNFSAYSKYPIRTNLVKFFRIDKLMPKELKKYLNKDIILICKKN